MKGSSVCFSHAWVRHSTLGKNVLSSDTGLGSVLPHGTQQLPRGKDREGEEAHRLGKKTVSSNDKLVQKL
jgi:hypothetical protein